ncbi:MAG: DNA polymerase III subunit delta, partial [Pirellulaceae bacterium]
MALQHAFDILTASEPAEIPAVAVLFGGDATLRSWTRIKIIGDEDATEVDGDAVQWSDLHDELSTASLFSMGERRTIVVRDGDAFIKRYRPEVEAYVAKPGSAGRLVLEIETLPANTRLYKAVNKDFLLIECRSPQVKSGRYSRPDVTKLRGFLTGFIAPRHQCKLSRTAADLLIDLVGDDLGILDTELAKLAVHLPIGGQITDALVHDVVHGWRGKTTWEIIDAAASGNAAEALRHLDRLLTSGERAIALLPQLSWSLRRLGMATAAVEAAEARGRRPQLKDALHTAGFRGRPQDLQRAESQLRQLGRQRAQHILPWLLEADLKLKGSHSSEGRDRWVLEELFLKLA